MCRGKNLFAVMPVPGQPEVGTSWRGWWGWWGRAMHLEQLVEGKVCGGAPLELGVQCVCYLWAYCGLPDRCSRIHQPEIDICHMKLIQPITFMLQQECVVTTPMFNNRSAHMMVRCYLADLVDTVLPCCAGTPSGKLPAQWLYALDQLSTPLQGTHTSCSTYVCTKKCKSTRCI